MERTKMSKKADAILCSDIHLREDVPVCRTDDYWKAQWNKLDQISTLQKLHGCMVLNGGDLFDKWKPSPMLLSEASKHMPDQFITVYGQHDLPQHNIELAYKSGIYNLMINGKLSILQNGHWNQSLGDGRTGFIVKGKQLTVQHVMNYQGKKPWPGCTDPMAASLLRKYPQFDLILTGDNHKTFVEEHEGRLLVNPGSMMRMDADQEDHRPCVFLWYADTNTVVPHYLQIEKGVVTREHLEAKEARESRISAFIDRLDGEYETKMSFEENIGAFFKANKTDKEVQLIVYKAIENGTD